MFIDQMCLFFSSFCFFNADNKNKMFGYMWIWQQIRVYGAKRERAKESDKEHKRSIKIIWSVVEVSLSSVSNIIAAPATTTEKYTEHAKAFSLSALVMLWTPFYSICFWFIFREIPSLRKGGLIGKTSLNAKLFTWCDDAEEDFAFFLFSSSVHHFSLIE